MKCDAYGAAEKVFFWVGVSPQRLKPDLKRSHLSQR
jgi:hypothetical protein